jgi:hypothetical protein
MSSRPFSPEKQSRSSRLGLFLAGGPLAAAFLLTAAPAGAQDAPTNCPPGSWFCAETPEKPAPAPAAKPAKPAPKPAPSAAADEQGLEPLPPADETPPPPPVRYRPPPPPPPVVIYQQPPRPPPPPSYYYYYHPRPARPIGQQSEWGLNLRAEGAIQGNGSQSTRPMEGVGIGLRYRPAPAFALEAGFDFLDGRDYYNNFRNETEFSVNALVFVNPRSRVQLYLLAGLFGSWANVTQDGNSPGNPNADQVSYTYFGGQAGVGLEFRIAKHFAMNIDTRAFLRSRTDSAAANSPEYVDASTGQTTNTSDGCLVTGGMTFYF